MAENALIKLAVAEKSLVETTLLKIYERQTHLSSEIIREIENAKEEKAPNAL